MKTIAALLLAAAFPAAALSATITRTLDFQDGPAALDGRSNFDYGGLRFSSQCWIHRGHGNEGQIWLQSDHDNSNCESLNQDPNNPNAPYEPPNPNFLGTGNENFYVDRHGKPFTLLSLAGAGFNGTEFTVVSSKGGRFHGEVPYLCCEPEIPYALPYKAFTLTGPLWTDITWFQLFNQGDFGWQPHQGWDDIRYSFNTVPAPATALLVAGGLGFLAITRRRRQSA